MEKEVKFKKIRKNKDYKVYSHAVWCYLDSY